MIIIAESGSTKTNWLTGNKELFETIGFDPFFFSAANIFDVLKDKEGFPKFQVAKT